MYAIRSYYVHNKFVVDGLRDKGAVFVEELSDCPDDRPVIVITSYSIHYTKLYDVAQPIDDELVVHDLVADIDRCAPFLDRHLDDLDRAVHARASYNFV